MSTTITAVFATGTGIGSGRAGSMMVSSVMRGLLERPVLFHGQHGIALPGANRFP